MKVARSRVELRGAIAAAPPGELGFVPTMGALHEGHLSLVRAARQRCAAVVVSIFVNPLQFAEGEDLDRYPRDESGDLAALEEGGVDVAFLPTVQEMYPPGNDVTVSAGALGSILEGAVRPGHFDGVATVVTKLFNMVRPDVAFFGAKDAQQVAVIDRLVADLSFDVAIAVGPTVREPDGLALSSRDAYLDPTERARATVLWRGLQAGAAALDRGAAPEAAEGEVASVLAAEAGVTIEYVAAVDPVTFQPAPALPVLLLVAARVGRTRLIDNLLVGTSDRGTGSCFGQ